MTPAQQVTASLARNIRQTRRAAGLSQAELAAKAGIHHGSLGFTERGERPTSVDTLCAIAAVLGVSPARLATDPSCPRCQDDPPAGFACLLCWPGGDLS